MSRIESFVPSTAKKAEEWSKRMHDKHIVDARPLHRHERSALQHHFEAEALDAVRIDEVAQMEKLRNQLAFIGIRFDFPIETTVDYTFDDCLLVRESPPSLDRPFHKLAHMVQYRQLGTLPFAEAYVRGFAENEFAYDRIPLQEIAYQLTSRHQAGEGWLATRAY